MDPVRNPFAPGAGSQPPELAGREEIIAAADTALQRVLIGRHDKSQIFLGLRGTGKTVLLNKIESLAEGHGHITSFIEAPENKTLVELIYPRIHQALRKLSIIESAKASAHTAMGTLKAFASAFKISIGDISISVDPETGTADSGILEYDLCELFVKVGEAAKAAERGWTLLIDEIQYLSDEELSALIVSIHRVNQKNLPVIFFGAGLPQVAALSGEAKSYAERLFNYPSIGALDINSAKAAIQQPILDEEEVILDEALDIIFEKTQGYPYFLQEWGFQAWNIAENSPIDASVINAATPAALRRLDEGFFRVRFDRLTPKERDYVFAMAKLGKGPYRSSDVADILGERAQSLGPCRAKIISKGMIYSPAHGDIDFTVPMFEDYLRRTHPELCA
ncbi:MAG: ATP-binding protein [Bacteroidetes bacterium]|nr:ATP-binding protein [Bacteroidota bacterium]MCB1557473.1 ATP-binding protein [Alphaproteobacteria bacterium]